LRQTKRRVAETAIQIAVDQLKLPVSISEDDLSTHISTATQGEDFLDGTLPLMPIDFCPSLATSIFGPLTCGRRLISWVSYFVQCDQLSAALCADNEVMVSSLHNFDVHD
jgi:hypothetical protein